MVHKVKKKRPMAYRIYIRYTNPHIIKFLKEMYGLVGIKPSKWFPLMEQRKYIADAKLDKYQIDVSPLSRMLGVETKIVKEPANREELEERKLLSALGLKKRSRLRGLVESVKLEI